LIEARGAFRGMLMAALIAAACVSVRAAQDANQTLSGPQRLRLAQRLIAEAQGLEALDDLGGAIETMKQAVALAPALAQPRGLLGRLYQMQGQAESAKEAYRTHQLLCLLAQANDSADPFIVQLAEAEGLMIYLINQERMTRGLCVLKPSEKLSKCARDHSVEMMKLDYFSHTSPVKRHATSLDRFVEVYGYKPRALAENLARRYGTLYSFSPEKIAETHADLMKSPKHRESILWDKVQEVGVGIAVNEHGDYWVTEMFALLR